MDQNPSVRSKHRPMLGHFVRNQATAIAACDFFVSITVTFRVLYVFVARDIGSRRILHANVTEHPTAEWTTQQFREVLAELHPIGSLFTITIRSFQLRSTRR